VGDSLQVSDEDSVDDSPVVVDLVEVSPVVVNSVKTSVDDSVEDLTVV
jgi:hypothetical protein